MASEIPSHNQIIKSEDLKSQNYLETINEWSNENLMELNLKKTKIMLFNFTRNYQFSTDISINGKNIDVVDESKLLGTIITSDLKWKRNTEEITKKANARMQILRKISKFNPKVSDMIQIYISYIRSILEQSCVVWNSSLTKELSDDLERIQKASVRIILGRK